MRSEEKAVNRHTLVHPVLVARETVQRESGGCGPAEVGTGLNTILVCRGQEGGSLGPRTLEPRLLPGWQGDGVEGSLPTSSLPQV